MDKHILSSFLLGAGVVLASCGQGGRYNLKGEITDTESDSVMVIVYNMNTREHLYTDTVPLVNHRYEAVLADTVLLGVQVTPLPKMVNGTMSAMRMSSSGPAYFLPGDKMTLSGKDGELKPSGTELYDALAAIQPLNDLQETQKGLFAEIKRLSADYEENELQIQELSRQVKQNSEQMADVIMEVIAKDPEAMVAAYLSMSLPAEKGIEAIGKLGEGVKKGPFGPLLQQTAERYENTLIKQKARENIKPGKLAPDFSLPGLDGKEQTLASFKGKYMLLDFWGTWCGWCVKGMPKMKKYYARYKNKVEFVGVCCGDTEEKWRKGVEELQLPWVNLFNGKRNEITNAYAISGYPTKILVDPEGKIVEVFVGESPALYEKLDKLFK